MFIPPSLGKPDRYLSVKLSTSLDKTSGAQESNLADARAALWRPPRDYRHIQTHFVRDAGRGKVNVNLVLLFLAFDCNIVF